MKDKKKEKGEGGREKMLRERTLRFLWKGESELLLLLNGKLQNPDSRKLEKYCDKKKKRSLMRKKIRNQKKERKKGKNKPAAMVDEQLFRQKKREKKKEKKKNLTST